MSANDLDSRLATEAVRIVGSDTTGTETVFARVTANQDLGVSDSLFVGGVNTALAVGAVAVEAKVGLTRLANRKLITIMPTDGSIYWGYSNAVTTSTGSEIFRNQFATFAVSDNVAIWLIAAGNRDVRISEGA
jgi:S-formylglutathione hydrolase FrmB